MILDRSLRATPFYALRSVVQHSGMLLFFIDYFLTQRAGTAGGSHPVSEVWAIRQV